MIPRNAEHKLQTMDIRLNRPCHCMAGLTSRYSTLRNIVMYPLFMASHDTLNLFSVVEAAVYSWKDVVISASTGCFWIMFNTFKRSQQLGVVKLLMILQVQLNKLKYSQNVDLLNIFKNYLSIKFYRHIPYHKPH